LVALSLRIRLINVFLTTGAIGTGIAIIAAGGAAALAPPGLRSTT
jgi:hypothetical protein